MRKRRALLFSVIGLVVLASPNAFRAETKRLKRVDDPVVIEGKEFISLSGSPIERLALMSRRGADFAPIPFQIDQKKPDGSYVYSSGPDAGTDPDPYLDSNDELVFMVKDTGESATDGKWPKGVEAGAEIELIDPKDGGKAYVYLFRFTSAAPRSKEDYIRVELDPKAKRRKVITYEYVMGGPLDRIYPDFLARLTPGGGIGPDVLDRLKMRGEFYLAKGPAIPFKMDDMTKSQDRGWVDGPVRVLHLAKGYMELTSFIRVKGAGYSNVMYYPNHMIWPMHIEVPSDSLKFIKKVTFRGFMDFTPNVFGSFPFSAANPLNSAVKLDGVMSDAEKKLDRETPIGWVAGFGPQGAIINRLFFTPKPAGVKTLPFYLDDQGAKDPPEDNPGTIGVGYNITGLETSVERGVVTYQYFYFLKELAPADVHRVLDILDNPLKWKIKPITLL